MKEPSRFGADGLDVRDSQPLIDDSRAYPSAEQREVARLAFKAQGSPFRGAFEHAAIGMGMVDLDGRLLQVNSCLCQILGYSREEFLARDFRSLTHPDDLPPTLDLAAKLIRGEIDYYHLEKRYLHKNGQAIWGLVSASLVRDPAGEPCYIIGQLQDVTARKQAEAQLESRLRHLERLTVTIPKILHALEATSAEQACTQLLQRVLDALDSPAGVILRVDGDRLIGCHAANGEAHKVYCSPNERCAMWNVALADQRCFANNAPHALLGTSKLARSLVAPIVHDNACVGLIHVGDAPEPYTAADVDFLRRVATMIAPAVQARIARRKLTPRECEIMDLLVSGMTLKQIAQALDITIQTAAKHRSRVFDKLNVLSDVELVHLSAEADPVRLAGMVMANPLDLEK